MATKICGKATVAEVRRMMRSNRSEYKDPKTGEVNATRLAEDVAGTLGLYENDRDYTIPEEVFEIAAEVADEGGAR